MKPEDEKTLESMELSPPTRGAWIETVAMWCLLSGPWSPPTRGAWIETCRQEADPCLFRSPPTRGAWIETST